MTDNSEDQIADALIRLPDSFDAIQDHFYEKGWTDGLPIVPPTQERVDAMLAGMAWRDPHEVLALVPPAHGKATLQRVAINAVMAGCKPEYLPVVVAALDCTMDKRYGLHHRQTTTHGSSPLIIVNGPVVKRLKINYGVSCFGSGWRANGTIGRALRLCHVNLGGAQPGVVDFCQHAHPGKYTFCTGENEDANPWEPLHVERGFKADQSVVTVVHTEAPHSMTENMRTDPDSIMEVFADSMATLGCNNLYSQGEPVLALGVEHAEYFYKGGWSKHDIKQAVYERARQPWRLVEGRGKSHGPFFPEEVDQSDPESMVPIINRPDDLVVIVAGGAGGKSMWCPTSGAQTLSASRAIDFGPKSG
ncbi:MAG: hypothetical protein RIB59_10265 [Rhodospirillales bacterium]